MIAISLKKTDYPQEESVTGRQDQPLFPFRIFLCSCCSLLIRPSRKTPDFSHRDIRLVPFGGVMGEGTSPRATMRKASLIAALSEGQPYSSLIWAMASRSVGSSRIVVTLACFFLMVKVYHVDR